MPAARAITEYTYSGSPVWEAVVRHVRRRTARATLHAVELDEPGLVIRLRRGETGAHPLRLGVPQDERFGARAARAPADAHDLGDGRSGVALDEAASLTHE